jgi:hypothetical protein
LPKSQATIAPPDRYFANDIAIIQRGLILPSFEYAQLDIAII